MTEDRSMLDVMRASRVLAFAVGALALIAGVVLIVAPKDVIETFAKIIGVLVAIVGIGEALEAVTTHRKGTYWGLLLVRGGLNVVTGLLLVFWPGITVMVIVWLFGVDLVLSGIVGLIASRGVPKELGRSSLVLRSIVGLLFGIAVMAAPDKTLTIIGWIVGLQLVAVGALLVWSGVQLSKTERELA